MPLHIRVNYEASWRNSFLDGTNDEPLPKNGRNYVGSMTKLKEDGNFKKREVSKNTVMGILCRLIGDQRKLYQARNEVNYYFAGLEDKILFQDLPSKKIENSELVHLRNVSGSTDQNSFTGMISSNHSAFTSDFSNELWGVLFLNLHELFDFIQDEKLRITKQDEFDPLIVVDQFVKLDKVKPIEIDNTADAVLQILKAKFSHGKDSVSYTLDSKKRIKPIVFYTSALYLQIERLRKNYNLNEILSKNGKIGGVSKSNFTKKDFMDRYTTGDKKLIFGNPYLLKEKIKGQGEVSSLLTKACGVLEIKIAISRDKAEELTHMIECAGVSSFYLGKKGLAYVENIHFIEADHEILS